MIHLDLVIGLLALFPIIIALIYGLAVVPRRMDNLRAAMELSLQVVAESDHARRRGRRVAEQSNYLERGKSRIDADFTSQYRYRLFIPAALLSLIYLVALFYCMSRVAGNLASASWLLRIPAVYAQVPAHDFLLYALIGAYVFNMGGLVRRTFLADVTEHVYWGAINRVIITSGLALALEGVRSIPAPFFFLIAFMPQVVLSKLRQAFGSLLGDSSDKSMDTPLLRIQGIDIWKEQRLLEEGIENVQNLATADVLTLAVKTHYPLRTLIDWIDQAIFVQRFPTLLEKARSNGLAVSAIELAWMAPDNQGDDKAAKTIARVLDLDSAMVEIALESLHQDGYVNILWTLWQTSGNGTDRITLSD